MPDEKNNNRKGAEMTIRRMKNLKVFMLTSSMLVWSATTWADLLSGKVIGVADGDTITILDSSNTQHKIRLAGIDAPEKVQPFGQVSKQNLSDMVFGKMVMVDWQKRDRYQRIVGKVLLNDRDVNLEQLRAGLAWHYKKYQHEQSVDDRVRYAGIEEEARLAKSGLWRVGTPIPPWDWRKRQRTQKM
jgi:endonuclease YncB( thermonuclease family)